MFGTQAAKLTKSFFWGNVKEMLKAATHADFLYLPN
jgi:hypothetical protein